MIKKLTKVEDFKNKKILFSDEVLEALLKLKVMKGDDNIVTFYSEAEIIHSLYIYSGDDIFITYLPMLQTKRETIESFYSDEKQEMHYSKEHGFYVEVEDENN